MPAIAARSTAGSATSPTTSSQRGSRFSRRPVEKSSSTRTRAPAREQRVGEVRADEPGAAGDQEAVHAAALSASAAPSRRARQPPGDMTRDRGGSRPDARAGTAARRCAAAAARSSRPCTASSPRPKSSAATRSASSRWRIISAVSTVPGESARAASSCASLCTVAMPPATSQSCAATGSPAARSSAEPQRARPAAAAASASAAKRGNGSASFQLRA